MKDGKPAYTYNFLGLNRYTIAAPQALPAGKATVCIDFVYDGGGPGKGGKATLSVNGKSVADGRVEKTQPNIFSADETADVGIDNQTPVAEGIGIGPDTRFTGKIEKITLEVKPVGPRFHPPGKFAPPLRQRWPGGGSDFHSRRGATVNARSPVAESGSARTDRAAVPGLTGAGTARRRSGQGRLRPERRNAPHRRWWSPRGSMTCTAPASSGQTGRRCDQRRNQQRPRSARTFALAGDPLASARCEFRRSDAALGHHGNPGLPQAGHQSDGYGFGDMYLKPLELGWHTTHLDVTAGFALWIPTGRYEPGGDNNSGQGQWGYELSAGATAWFDEAHHFNFAVHAFYDIYSPKRGDVTVGSTTTQLQTGNILYLQGGLGYSLLGGMLNIGIPYYVQLKITEDTLPSGIGVVLPGIQAAKSWAIGLGAEVDLGLECQRRLDRPMGAGVRRREHDQWSVLLRQLQPPLLFVRPGTALTSPPPPTRRTRSPCGWTHVRPTRPWPRGELHPRLRGGSTRCSRSFRRPRIDRVRRFGDVRRFAPGELLCRVGRPSPGMYVILSGRLAVVSRDALGQPVPLTPSRRWWVPRTRTRWRSSRARFWPTSERSPTTRAPSMSRRSRRWRRSSFLPTSFARCSSRKPSSGNASCVR